MMDAIIDSERLRIILLVNYTIKVFWARALPFPVDTLKRALTPELTASVVCFVSAITFPHFFSFWICV